MKKIFRYFVMIFNIMVTFILLFLIGLTFITDKKLMDGGLINYISLIALLISVPTMYTGIKDIYHPDKKKVKLTGKCPNYKHLVEYQLEEN